MRIVKILFAQLFGQRLWVVGLSLMTTWVYADAGSRIHLVVNAPSGTPAGATLYLTGQGFNGCHWDTRCAPLLLNSDGYFETFLTPDSSSASFEFKVTRGDWSTEAVDALGAPLGNYHLDSALPGREAVVDVVNWRDLPALGVTGVVEHFSVSAPELKGKRQVHVWLPPSYLGESNRSYPVLYMHDGQNAFDPATSAYGVDWGVDEAMTRLIARHEIREAIVVAVECGDDRDAEYDYSLRGKDYANFLIKTLKPQIDSQYRTLKGPDSTFLMGSSMGALISVEIGWANPDVFSAAAALSLPVFVTQGSIYEVLKSYPVPSGQFRIYMDHGTSGQDLEYGKFAQPFYQWLLQVGMPPAENQYRVFPYADHNEINWSRRLEVPLKFLLGSQ